MRFLLEAILEFSKPLESLKTDFPAIVAKEINAELFRKGVPEKQDGSRLIHWTIEGTKLLLTIEGTNYLRPHDALLRLRNYFAEKLGKDYKIGVRSMIVKDYEISFKPEKAPKEKVSVKVPWVRDIEERNGELTVKLQNLDSTAIEDRYVERIMKRIEEKISAQYVKGKAATTTEVKKSRPRINKYKFKQDITEELLKRGWVKKFSASGVWHFMPPMTALIRAIEQLIVERIALPMGFQEILLPRLISLDTERKKGQTAIANEMFWVCPPASRDPGFFDEFVDYVEITQTVPRDLLLKKLEPPIGAISYAQCEGFYQLFEKEILDLDALPMKFYDRFGPTWRYEAGGIKGIERLNEFYRIEFVFIGSPDQVVKIRNEVKDRALEIIDKVFNMDWRLDKVIPVYLEHAGKVEDEEEDLVKTYDLTIMLPFETLDRKEKELEIASFHVHKDFYAERFNFKDKSERAVWTGCSGLGPTRFAYIFLLRWGFDFEKWPEEIRKIIKKLYGKFPQAPKMVSWP